MNEAEYEKRKSIVLLDIAAEVGIKCVTDTLTILEQALAMLRGQYPCPPTEREELRGEIQFLKEALQEVRDQTRAWESPARSVEDRMSIIEHITEGVLS